ncbi:LacI family DNA-binding transcriptional regulator [Streptomyces sp. MP131-18]|uniref:LacI family DNA-binding transcriptional regulator n=1 Tax=Streptomyces sp. MP131-18 TaxID=1857892 RepID=UPI00097BC113|nr:LacI family DNA-binding transcriptional regulator [Streptomyces sp. MP131-18]ONK15477.1 HTH-type transcriptional repressor CytR [Streptomyces sp. MP131-18]
MTPHGEHAPRAAAPAGRPTILTVAERAGVGRTTVSRVLNGSPRVSEAARAAVLAAIAELDFVPNSVARSLVTSRADAIALVVSEPGHRPGGEPYFSELVRGVSDGLAGTPLQLLVFLVRDRAERERLRELLTARRVDGVVLVPVAGNDPLPGLLERLGLPVALAGRRSAREPLPHVHADDAGGAAEAVRHLLARGRTAIGTITGPQDLDVAAARLGGWRAALRAAGRSADDSLVAAADFTEAGGRLATRALLARHPDLDAVFAATDVMAAGALAELRRQGLRVPDDVALVGFGDLIVARHTEPPLTTVRRPLAAVGRAVTELLLAEMAARGSTRRRAPLPTSLVVRAST